MIPRFLIRLLASLLARHGAAMRRESRQAKRERVHAELRAFVASKGRVGA